LHNIPIHQPGLEEDFYRQHIAGSDAVQALRRAMDEWCAVWFWPIDALRQDLAPLPLSFLSGDQGSVDTVAATADQIRFFHWELEFPDVFTPERTGFDAVIGNPPWDVMKPNSQEFFSDYDPLYRMVDKQAAVRQQRQLFAADPAIERRWLDYNATFRALANWAANAADPFDVTLARGKEGEQLKSAWESRRKTRPGYAAPEHPFRLQGSADVNSYKMFAELFWHLLRPGGRLGAILPTGLYSDFGTRSLREELLFRGQLEFLYAFQNEKRVFSAAHHAFKQAAVFATKGGSTTEFRARFRMGVGDSPQSHEIPDDILGRDGGLTFTPETVRANSPKTLSLVELRTPRDLEIFEKIYANSIRIGDRAPGWEVDYACEFHMTNDSKHFPPLEKWESQGYRPDPFGRWIGPDGDVALPLYEGRMVGQFDVALKGWVEGKGRTAVWRDITPDHKRFEPQFLMSMQAFRARMDELPPWKVGGMSISAASNTRTVVTTPLGDLPCSHSLFTLRLPTGLIAPHLALSSLMNSLTFDFTTRARLTGINLSWFILGDCPIPQSLICGGVEAIASLSVRAAALVLVHRRFAPDWLKLAHEFPAVFGFDPLAPSASHQGPVTAWKHWWAVTEADRLRLRVEIDALCADLYGLDPDDFDWIVRDDPKDPKGFYRVDRQLPFRERLTGLSAAAFRALKAGNWSAETAGQLTNDQFLDLLGIPELTSAAAAKSKNLAAPLIQKRDGCHNWHPEHFPEEDPRHGWTWHHCRRDALTLLGSEQALEQYIAQTADDTSSSASANENPTTSDQPPKPTSSATPSPPTSSATKSAPKRNGDENENLPDRRDGEQEISPHCLKSTHNGPKP
jgi:hypothetical protein